mmetsp:Transcript_24993/g.77241  ORF Transcript_24993/g.77241 Transcript_24993/m.77241 type:complete len:265 (-) Transcript_24993:300-1094(-)
MRSSRTATIPRRLSHSRSIAAMLFDCASASRTHCWYADTTSAISACFALSSYCICASWCNAFCNSSRRESASAAAAEACWLAMPCCATSVSRSLALLASCDSHTRRSSSARRLAAMASCARASAFCTSECASRTDTWSWLDCCCSARTCVFSRSTSDSATRRRCASSCRASWTRLRLRDEKAVPSRASSSRARAASSSLHFSSSAAANEAALSSKSPFAAEAGDGADRGPVPTWHEEVVVRGSSVSVWQYTCCTGVALHWTSIE